MTVKEISEYITFPRTFEKYRWYKPILVFIIGAIIYLILSLILLCNIRRKHYGPTPTWRI